MSNIEWTEKTWNPVVGCTPVSPGCLNCYAARMARRQEAMGTPGYEPREPGVEEIAARHAKGVTSAPSIDKTIRIAEVRGGRPVFTGEVRCLPDRLEEPLRWRKPRLVFVNSMSDLFFGDEADRKRCEAQGVPFNPVPFEFIDRVFAVMALCPQHTFQVLTKRPERMAEYLNSWPNGMGRGHHIALQLNHDGTSLAGDPRTHGDGSGPMVRLPLPNVWLGTSTENQATADERIPHLLRCPAKVRFLSVEPMLGPVDVSKWLGHPLFYCPVCGKEKRSTDCAKCGTSDNTASNRIRGVDWVICGGESGPGARPFDVAWPRSLRDQCKAAGVPFFMKQFGDNVQIRNDEVSEWLDECGMGLDFIETDRVGMQGDPVRVLLNKRKGNDMSEWPSDLRVREMPEVRS